MSKVILITGASSDLGLGITRDLLGAGHQIFAHYSSNGDQLHKMESSLLKTFKADLTDDQQVKNMVIAAKNQFGRIDVLINMIGPFSEMNILEETPQKWRQLIELNLNVVFAACHFCQPELIQTRGHILNFGYSGIQNLTAWPSATGYAAAKAGLAVLTKSLAQALAPHRVRVNAVCPGWIDSGHFDDSKRKKIVSQVPMRRIGEPQEVTDIVRWILIDSPTYLTGAFIPVSGGLEF